MIYFITNSKLYENYEGGLKVSSHIYIKKATINEIINYFKNHKEIEIDTETLGYSPHSNALLSLQLGDKDNQFVIDCLTVNINPLKSLIETKLLLMQNAQFDLRFLYHYNIYPSKIYDTLLMECILTTGLGDREDIEDIKKDCGKKDVAEEYAGRKVGLNDLSKKYLGREISKDIRGVIHREGLTPRVIAYAAGDVDSLGLIKEKQLEEFEKFKEKYKTNNNILDLENNVVKVFSRLLYNGINIDKPKYKKEVIDTVTKLLNGSKNNLNIHLKKSKISRFTTINPTTGKSKSFEIVFGGNLFDPFECNINWNSPEQKTGILKELDPTITSAGYSEINKRTEVHPIFKELIQYNKYKKLQDSFGESFLELINPDTYRMHSSIWQILSTGRISMSSPNLAQIPSKGDLGKIIRSCFIPRNENYVIVGGDYSGMELRIIAEFSQDPLWVKTFKDGGDLHSILCSETFDIFLDKVKTPFYANPDITYRDVQKIIDFGLAYGMSKYKLANTILVSVDEADAIINKFFSKVPKVKEFLDNLGNFAKTKGYITTPSPYNRVRRFPKWEYLQQNPHSERAFNWLGEIERAGKNTPIQGANGDIIKKALILMQDEIDNNNWDVNILLTVYDEIQVEVNKSVAEEWRVVQNRIMKEAAEVVLKTVPIVVDCKVSPYWEK